MIPLWMMAISPLQSQWGWAFRSSGSPWVAQRVCPIPKEADSSFPLIISARSATLPAFFSMISLPSFIRARPAES